MSSVSFNTLYQQMCNERLQPAHRHPLTPVNQLRLLFQMFISGFLANWRQIPLPEIGLNQQLHLLAFRALQRGDHLADEATSAWCAEQLSAAYHPELRYLALIGKNTALIDNTGETVLLWPISGCLSFTLSVLCGLSALRSTWRLLRLSEAH